MSLFPSSFETVTTPSASNSSSLSKTHSKKRKHSNNFVVSSTSSPNPSRAEKLRATQINLDKLIAKVERGEVKERDGQEPMGSRRNGGGASGKRHKGRKQNVESAGGSDSGTRKFDIESNHESVAKKNKVNNDTLNTTRFPEKPISKTSKLGKHDDKRLQVDSQSFLNLSTSSPQSQLSTKSSMPRPSVSRPAPAELPLPLPHHTNSSKLMSSSGSNSAVAGGNGKMTDLQKGMRAKLEGARFRWINEQLYSIPSTEAAAMMRRDPKIFADYHHTHRALTSAWPSPPLPLIIERLSTLPLRSLIVDLGCGDAGLAKALVPRGLVVLSFDLVGDSGIPSGQGSAEDANSSASTENGRGGWVVETDFLTHVPLPGRPGGDDHLEDNENNEIIIEGGKKQNLKRTSKIGSNQNQIDQSASEVVDVVVCCLSLMGVNWLGGIYEACRILRKGGKLQIAEVTSRFVSTEDFVNAIESFGFHLEQQEEPSTHFTLFEFTKISSVPLGPVPCRTGWIERVTKGEQILRGCVYKKR